MNKAIRVLDWKMEARTRLRIDLVFSCNIWERDGYNRMVITNSVEMDKESPFSFAGKICVITGGSKGLGLNLTNRMISAGATVVVVSKTPPMDVKNQSIGSIGNHKLEFISADLTNSAGCYEAVEKTIMRCGSIDFLINNAGIQNLTSILDYEVGNWEKEMALMLTAPFLLAKGFAPYMIEKNSGKIVNISSISGFQAARNIAGYTTAKHGIIGLTKAMANEFAMYNINVNCVAPGLFESAMSRHVYEDKTKLEALKARTPRGKLGEPEEIVDVILYLLSDYSKHIHGHTVVVDGGWLGR